MNSELNESNLSIKTEPELPPSKGIFRKIASICWRIFRVLLFLGCILTYILFWWSFLGIIAGFLFYKFSKDPLWRVNGMVLAFFAGFTTFLVEGIKVDYLLLGIGIILLYAVIEFFIVAGRKIYRMLRGRPAPKKSRLLEWWKNLSSRVRTGIKVGVVLAPILMWSVVSLDFGVMFNNKPQLLWVHAPSTVNIGENFSMMVQVWDKYERLSGGYGGTVEFSLVSYNLSTLEPISPVAQLPDSYTFKGRAISLGFIPAYVKDGDKDNGWHTFTVRINTPGLHYLLVNDSHTGNTYWSNPVLVQNFSAAPKLYWGDLHSHSIMSDGSGTPAHSFDFARNVACLEFHALTDHGEDLSLYGISDWGFGVVEKAANQAYEPGKFVTFQGAEWTPHYPPSIFIDFGHYMCIFSGDEVPHLASNYQKDPMALWDLLDDFCNRTGARALAIPHHTIRKAFIQDWTYINPKYVKLAECTSVHGECLFEGHHPLNYRGSVDIPSEIVNGSSIIDAFKMGLRMTLCANGDNHDGHPGHSLSHTDAYIGHQWPFAIDHPRNGHPYPSGLTAVWADNLTRDDVFTALENQRIFANSDYGRPILKFSIDSITVGNGSTLKVATNTTQRNITIFLAQDGAPAPDKSTAASVTPNWAPNWTATIEVIKNGILWNSTIISTPICRIDLADSSLISGASYDHCIESDGQYYINSYSDNPVTPLDLNTEGADFYLVRIVGANGRTSYAGPTWVESLG